MCQTMSICIKNGQNTNTAVDPTFPVNAALGFCDFETQWRNGIKVGMPWYTVAPCGVFWRNVAMPTGDRTQLNVN